MIHRAAATILPLVVAAVALLAGQPESAGTASAYRLTFPSLAREAAPPAGFEVAFLDVGQGDAILITAGGQRLLIDSGRTGSRVMDRLQRLGVTDLDAIVATHPDADHIGGFPEVLRRFAVERIYLNGDSSDSQVWAEFTGLVAAEGAQVLTVKRGDRIPLGHLSLPVLHPSAPTDPDTNTDSIVLEAGCGAISVLLTGDATAKSEASMIAAGVARDVTVLKVGHHGSNTSSTIAYVAATAPEYVVFSAGLGNQFGHPHPLVVDTFAAIGAELLYTDTTAGDDTFVMGTDCQRVTWNRR